MLLLKPGLTKESHNHNQQPVIGLTATAANYVSYNYALNSYKIARS